MVTQKRQAVVALEVTEAIGTAISFPCYKGAEPLAVGMKKSVAKIAGPKGNEVIEIPIIWMAADPDQPLVERRFLVLMTAQVTTTECKISKACYVGTCFILGQPLHIFDMGEA